MRTFHQTQPIPNPLRLGKTDKLVIKDFINKTEEWGLKLHSSGRELNGNWMGGRGIAFWDGDKIYFRDLGSKASETVQRFIKKNIPKNDFGGYKQTASWQAAKRGPGGYFRGNPTDDRYKVGETLFRGTPVYLEKLMVADIKKRSPQGRGTEHARNMANVHRAASDKAIPSLVTVLSQQDGFSLPALGRGLPRN